MPPATTHAQSPWARSIDRRLRTRAAAAALAAAVCAGVFASGASGDRVVLWVDNLATTLAALGAAALCFRAARRDGAGQKRFWWLLGAACGFWTLAEMGWAVYDLVLQRPVPVPSWADVGYLGAIPLAVAALLSHPAARGSRARRARQALDAVVVALALLFTSWTVVLGPLSDTTDLTRAGGLVALAYPLGDVVMLFFIVLIVRRVSGAQRVTLWCLLAGLTAMAVSDTAYAYLVEVEGYASGSIVDAGWIAAYLAIAVAASCSDARSGPARRTPTFSASPLPALVAPFVPVLAALALAALQLERGVRLDAVSWLLAPALVLLVLVRQALVIVEVLRARSSGPQAFDLSGRIARAAVGEPVAAAPGHPGNDIAGTPR